MVSEDNFCFSAGKKLYKNISKCTEILPLHGEDTSIHIPTHLLKRLTFILNHLQNKQITVVIVRKIP